MRLRRTRTSFTQAGTAGLSFIACPGLATHSINNLISILYSVSDGFFYAVPLRSDASLSEAGFVKSYLQGEGVFQARHKSDKNFLKTPHLRNQK